MPARPSVRSQDSLFAYGRSRIDGVDPHDEPWAGRRYLTGVQYADESNPAARQSIYAFQSPRIDLPSWALGLAGLTGNETVLDVGCGNGAYLAWLNGRHHEGPLVGVDLSAGMLTAALARAPGVAVLNADAAALPLATASADVVLAIHVLYHCPDRAAAIAELARVAAPGGVALVITNGAGHLAQMNALLADTITESHGDQARTGRPQLRQVPGRDRREGARSVVRQSRASLGRQCPPPRLR